MVKNLDEHYDSDLCNVKYHLLDYKVADIEGFGTVFVLKGSQNEHFNVYINSKLIKMFARKANRNDGKG